MNYIVSNNMAREETHSKTGSDISTSKAWGHHLIADMGNCDRKAITSAEIITAFCIDLVAAIDMKAYGKPIIKYFATHSPESAGYSLVQLIETSNICAHFAEMTGDVYLDIFSCKSFSIQKAIAVCEQHFSPQVINHTILMRGVKRLPAL